MRSQVLLYTTGGRLTTHTPNQFLLATGGAGRGLKRQLSGLVGIGKRGSGVGVVGLGLSRMSVGVVLGVGVLDRGKVVSTRVIFPVKRVISSPILEK